MDRDQKLLELLKCKTDPIYFIENYVTIEEPGGRVPFKMYEKQKEYVKTFKDKHYIIVLKSRQIGISTVSRAIVAWAVTFYSNIVVGVISRDASEATDFARKTRYIIEDLPSWMQPGFNKKTEQSFILSNNSELVAGTVNQSNPSSVFRGKTISILVIDEAAFIPKIEYAYTGIAPATLRAHQVAKEKELPYGIMIISTPNGTNTHPIGYWYYDMWTRSVKGETNFVPLKIHYSDAPFADENWIKEAKKVIPDKLQWEQEMELKFITGKDSFLDTDTALKIQGNAKEPIEVIDRVYFNRRGEKVGDGQWRIYSKIFDQMYYIMGIDIAGGYVGTCNSAVQIVNADSMEQVAEFEGKLRVTDLLDEIKTFINEYFPSKNILIVPEMNSVGLKFVEDMEEDDELYELLYFTKVKDPKTGKVKKLIPGIATTGKTRPLMIDSLYWTIKEHPYMIKSQQLLNQLISLDKNLRGGLSDLSMAFAIVTYVLKYDKESITDKKQIINDWESKELFDDLFISGNNPDNQPQVINLKLF